MTLILFVASNEYQETLERPFTCMQIKPFTPEQRKFIIDNKDTLTQAEIARRIGRTRTGVQRFLQRKNLEAVTRYAYWTPEDKKTLLLLSEKYSYKEIAKKMGRTPNNVQYMLSKLGATTRTDVFSLRKACAYTGYDKAQLYRARKALHQSWKLSYYWKDPKASKPMPRYRISYEQLEDICEYLKTEV